MTTRPASPEDLEYVARDLDQMENPAMARRVRACMEQWLTERGGPPPRFLPLSACEHGHSAGACGVDGCRHYGPKPDPGQLTLPLEAE
jgi:hypothetical protein